MPPGRPLNHDAKIARLVSDLRKALIAREAARIETAVSQHIDDLVSSIQRGVDIGGARAVQAIASTPTPAPASKKKVRSAASRALQAKKMKAYWAARKAKESKGGAKGKATKEAATAK